MKTIDITPTWRQWLDTALFVIASSTDTSKTLETLKPEFVKIAKIADQHNEEAKKEKEDLTGDPSMDKSIEWIREASGESLKRLCEAIDWQLNPYIDEYSEDTLKDEHPHIYELSKAYSNITGYSNMKSQEDIDS